MKDKYEGVRDSKTGKIRMHQKWARALLKKQHYKFAKTMPQNPHAYTLRKNWEDGELFEAVVQFIRDNGQKEFWGWGRARRPYMYYYFDGYKYWTMGAPLHETILINRAKDESDEDREIRLTPSEAW